MLERRNIFVIEMLFISAMFYTDNHLFVFCSREYFIFCIILLRTLIHANISRWFGLIYTLLHQTTFGDSGLCKLCSWTFKNANNLLIQSIDRNRCGGFCVKGIVLSFYANQCLVSHTWVKNEFCIADTYPLCLQCPCFTSINSLVL